MDSATSTRAHHSTHTLKARRRLVANEMEPNRVLSPG
jgi:hypothetical protein